MRRSSHVVIDVRNNNQFTHRRHHISVFFFTFPHCHGYRHRYHHTHLVISPALVETITTHMLLPVVFTRCGQLSLRGLGRNQCLHSKSCYRPSLFYSIALLTVLSCSICLLEYTRQQLCCQLIASYSHSLGPILFLLLSKPINESSSLLFIPQNQICRRSP